MIRATWTSERSLKLAPDRGSPLLCRAIAGRVRSDGPAWVRDAIPSGGGVLVLVDPLAMPGDGPAAFDGARGAIERVARAAAEATDTDASAERARSLTVPVCYDESSGPDLAEVARLTGLAAREIVERHTGQDYTVRSLGFSPGFAYLESVHPSIQVPRRDEPRPRVPPGSVGLAGDATGVYPLATPGGWRLIGRTALRLFRPDRTPPALLAPGDTVRFEAVDRAELDRLLRDAGDGPEPAP